MSNEHRIDEVTGSATTGHVWDGIRELNTPLPRWWLWTFYACIAFAVGYTMCSTRPFRCSTRRPRGLLGYSTPQRGRERACRGQGGAGRQYVATVAIAIRCRYRRRRCVDALRRRRRPAPRSWSIACSATAPAPPGRRAIPNLNDDDWLWGGTLEQIHTTITHGIRFAQDPDTRISEMPAFGDVITGGPDRSRSRLRRLPLGTVSDAALAAPGAKVFADNCAACHGDDAKATGSSARPPERRDLALRTGEKRIVAQIREPRHGVMPAWALGSARRRSRSSRSTCTRSAVENRKRGSILWPSSPGDEARLSRASICVPAIRFDLHQRGAACHAAKLRPTRGTQDASRTECRLHGKSSSCATGDTRAGQHTGRTARSRGRQRRQARQPLYAARKKIFPKRASGSFRQLQMAGHGGHARHLLGDAVDAVGPRPIRPRPGRAGRSRQPALLLLLHRDLAAGILLRRRPAGHGRASASS